MIKTTEKYTDAGLNRTWHDQTKICDTITIAHSGKTGNYTVGMGGGYGKATIKASSAHVALKTYLLHCKPTAPHNGRCYATGTYYILPWPKYSGNGDNVRTVHTVAVVWEYPGDSKIGAKPGGVSK